MPEPVKCQQDWHSGPSELPWQAACVLFSTPHWSRPPYVVYHTLVVKDSKITCPVEFKKASGLELGLTKRNDVQIWEHLSKRIQCHYNPRGHMVALQAPTSLSSKLRSHSRGPLEASRNACALPRICAQGILPCMDFTHLLVNTCAHTQQWPRLPWLLAFADFHDGWKEN
jgi:hypothetical protein